MELRLSLERRKGKSSEERGTSSSSNLMSVRSSEVRPGERSGDR